MTWNSYAQSFFGSRSRRRFSCQNERKTWSGYTLISSSDSRSCTWGRDLVTFQVHCRHQASLWGMVRTSFYLKSESTVIPYAWPSEVHLFCRNTGGVFPFFHQMLSSCQIQRSLSDWPLAAFFTMTVGHPLLTFPSIVEFHGLGNQYFTFLRSIFGCYYESEILFGWKTTYCLRVMSVSVIWEVSLMGGI